MLCVQRSHIEFKKVLKCGDREMGGHKVVQRINDSSAMWLMMTRSRCVVVCLLRFCPLVAWIRTVQCGLVEMF
jgi:hypothetical protein